MSALAFTSTQLGLVTDFIALISGSRPTSPVLAAKYPNMTMFAVLMFPTCFSATSVKGAMKTFPASFGASFMNVESSTRVADLPTSL